MRNLTPDVYEGLNGYLFLTGGTNKVASFFSEGVYAVDSLCATWSDLLLNRNENARLRDIKYMHCFIPDKLSVLRELAVEVTGKMTFPAEFIEANYSKMLSSIIVPVTNYLRKQAQTYQVFYKTDTHFTIAGSFSVYQMICFIMGVNQNEQLILRNASSIEGFWDLGSKVEPKRKEVMQFGRFGLNAKRIYANELVTARENGSVKNDLSLHVGSIVRYLNQQPDIVSLRILVFGDSFFEYRPHMLTGMFADTVKEIMFVWSTSIDWKIVDEYKPDVLLTEIAERFMRVVPADDIDLRSHGLKKLAAVLANSAQ
jgi:alginate O-acetyltransferase complex protein AlgJ